MYRKYVLTLLCLALAISLAPTDPAYACRDYDGHRNSIVPPECGRPILPPGGSVSDAIYATWPASSRRRLRPWPHANPA